MARYVAYAMLVLLGLVILVGIGWVAFLMYLFLAGVAGALTWGIGVGGGVVEDVSRGRFSRRDR